MKETSSYKINREVFRITNPIEYLYKIRQRSWADQKKNANRPVIGIPETGR